MIKNKFLLLMIIVSFSYSVMAQFNVECTTCLGFLSSMIRVYQPHNVMDINFPDNMATVFNFPDYYSSPEVTMLKNEGESFQIAFNSSGMHDIALDYKVYYNDFETTDLELEIFKVEFTNVTYYLYKNSGDRSPIGYYTDPLVPYTKNEIIDADGSVIWWITVRSFDVSRAGDYTIEFNITRDFESNIFIVNVSLLNYVLNNKPKFRAIFETKYFEGGTDNYRSLDYHDANSVEEKKEVIKNYADYLNKNKLNHAKPFIDPSCSICSYTYNTAATALPIIYLNETSIDVNFTSFDYLIQRYIESGNMNSFLIAESSWGFGDLYVPYIYGNTRISQGTDFENYLRIYTLYWNEVISHLLQKDWLKYALIAIDEPFATQRLSEASLYINYYNNFTDIVRNISSQPRILVWWDSNSIALQDSIQNLSNIDFYSPIDYNSDSPLKALEAPINNLVGNTGGKGTYWTSNFHIHLDRPVIDNRIWGIKYWKYNVTNLYHWDVLVFAYDISLGKINPWKDVSYRWGAGGINLFYPPCKEGKCSTFNAEIIPSIRLESYRDSIEDYESLYILNDLIIKAQSKGINTGTEEIAYSNFVNLVSDYSVWSRDISLFERNREEVLNAISNLSLAVYCGGNNLDNGEGCDDGDRVSVSGVSGGDRERKTKYHCNDGIDNDFDGLKDANDLGCSNLYDDSEVDDTCRERWICDEWQGCVNGVKVRECFDTTSCGTELTKPDTEQNCGLLHGIPELQDLELPGLEGPLHEENPSDLDFDKIKIRILITALILFIIALIIIIQELLRIRKINLGERLNEVENWSKWER